MCEVVVIISSAQSIYIDKNVDKEGRASLLKNVRKLKGLSSKDNT